MPTTLRVGLDAAAPVPLHTDFYSKSFEGFEVDLLKAISQRMGASLSYHVSWWKDILQQLSDDKLDVICSAVTVTQERRGYLDFSDPYLDFTLCAVTRKDSRIDTLDGLNDRKMGVRVATEAEKYIQQRLRAKELVYFDTNDEAYGQLLSGNIDCLVDDSPIAGAFVKGHPQLRPGLPLPHSDSAYAIALNKGNSALQDELNHHLTTLRQSGEYDQLHRRWF